MREEHDKNGNCLTKMVTIGGATLITTYTYDACNRMITQATARSGLTVQSLGYSYWSTGQLKTLTDNVAQTATTYVYDAAGQVISELIAKGSLVTVRSYTYDGSGNRTSVSDSSTSVTVEDTNAIVTYYGTWTSRTGTSYSGGSDRYTNVSGASAAIGFDGVRLEVLATTASNYGKARVYLDDVYVGDADHYSSTTKYQQVVFDTGILTPGRHTLRFEWTGTKNPASKGTTIALDALRVVSSPGPYASRREQNAPGVTYAGTWTTVSSTSHSGGSIATVNASGAALTTTLTGAGFVLVAATGATYGIARVYVDGIQTDLVDLYSASTRYRQAVLRKTLPYGTHTVKVEWSGTKYAKARATTINIDAIDMIAGAPAGPTPTQTLAFDAANRVVGFTYDARGNVLNDGTHTYTWDAYNRLTQVKLASTGALVASYGNDADGMRQTATAGGVTTQFVVDELSDEIVALTDATGAVVAKFIRDAAGALVAMARGGAVFTYLINAHGDVTALVDAAGAVIARWTYDAWGNPTEYDAAGTHVAIGTAGNPFLYAGYFFDVATGLYYLRARYYDPATGRFLSMDPEPGRTTDRLSQNPYIYCQNDPVNNTDRSGRRIDGLGHRPRNRQEAEAERRAQRAANEARKKRQAEARRAAQARAAADRAARAAMAAARVKEATSAKQARATADRNARLGMDKDRQAQGAATRERNAVYESVRSGQAMWDMALKGASTDQMRAYVNGIQDSAGYQQWGRGNEDAYQAHQDDVRARSAAVAAQRAKVAQEAQLNAQVLQDMVSILGVVVGVASLVLFAATTIVLTGGALAPAWAAGLSAASATLAASGIGLSLAGVGTAYYRRSTGDPTYDDAEMRADVAVNAVSAVTAVGALKAAGAAPSLAGSCATGAEVAGIENAVNWSTTVGFSVPLMTYDIYQLTNNE